MIGIAPERKNEIQELAMKSLLAATFANLLNGTIVGMFFFCEISNYLFFHILSIISKNYKN